MEVRCGGCNKLFRVADEKITGKGVKFHCTRCGEYVKITREEFENYTLSKTAVTALDMFESRPKPAAEPGPPKESVPSGPPPGSVPEAVGAEVPEQEEKPAHEDFDLSSGPDILKEAGGLAESEPAVFNEPSALPELNTETEREEQAAPSLFAETQEEPDRNNALPADLGQADQNMMQAGMPEPPAETAGVLSAEAKPTEPPEPAMPAAHAEPTRTVQRPAGQRKPESGLGGPLPEAAEAPKKEPVRTPSPARPSGVIGAAPAAPRRSGALLAVLLVLLVLALAAGGGYYFLFMKPAVQPAAPPAPSASSTEGLRITNSSGSLEQNGDLLITGFVENATNTTRTNWYIVAVVYDANGKELNRIGLLNGRQLYTQRDYDVLAKRGANVEELKARPLKEQAVTIPPKGKVPFTIRYLQPPSGVASFNTTVEPVESAGTTTGR